MLAAVYDGKRIEVAGDVEVREPRAGEVAIRVHAAGLCHSDLSVVNGTIPFPPPVVLGHEGAGVVEAVGEGVDRLAPGDHVALTTVASCGACAACDAGHPTMCRSGFGKLSKPFTRNADKLFAFANTSVFVERTVVRANQAVPIPKELPMPQAALIGCGVLTGVGAVLNRAKVPIGATVAVIGVGGIGLNVIQGARIAGASKIIAVDTNPAKQEAARCFGATEFIDPTGDDTAKLVKEAAPGGVDYAFECVGHPALIRASIDMLGWAGTSVLLGVPKADAEAGFLVSGMYMDKTVMGCRYGSSRPHTDIARYVELYQSGRLLLDELITATYELADIEQAIADLEAGKLARGVFTLA